MSIFAARLAGSKDLLFLLSPALVTVGVGVLRGLRTRGEISGVLADAVVAALLVAAVLALAPLALALAGATAFLVCLVMGESFSASLSSFSGTIDLRNAKGGLRGRLLLGVCPLWFRVRLEGPPSLSACSAASSRLRLFLGGALDTGATALFFG